MGNLPVQITVRLFSYFRESVENPNGILQMALPKGAHVKDIFRSIKLKPDEISLVMINHHRASLDDILQDGDFVEVFPIVGGG